MQQRVPARSLEGAQAFMCTAKHAFSRPHKRSNPAQRSGAAKKRFAFMRNKYSDFLGNDAIQVLALEPGSFIIALNALKLAAATFLLQYPHLFVGCS